MSDSMRIPVVVTVDDGHLDQIQSIAKTLTTQGVQVDNVLATSGIITGAAPSSDFRQFAQVAGVKDVERGGEMYAIK